MFNWKKPKSTVKKILLISSFIMSTISIVGLIIFYILFFKPDIVKVKVIGMLKLMDKGEQDNKVIAVTDNGTFKKIDTLKEMLFKHPNVIPIVRAWFEGYKDPGKIVFMGYENREKTIKYIEESHINWTKHKF